MRDYSRERYLDHVREVSAKRMSDTNQRLYNEANRLHVCSHLGCIGEVVVTFQTLGWCAYHVNIYVSNRPASEWRALEAAGA